MERLLFLYRGIFKSTDQAMSEVQSSIINDLIAAMIIRLREQMDLPLTQAMSVVYGSETVKHLSDISTGLYENGSLFLYELLHEELRTGRFPSVDE